MRFQKYKNNNVIKLGTQRLRDSELKWQLFYDFNSTMDYSMEWPNANDRSLEVFE
jgi:hypothetical protein